MPAVSREKPTASVPRIPCMALFARRNGDAAEKFNNRKERQQLNHNPLPPHAS